MYLKPCRYCHDAKTCERKKAALKQMRGIGITAATIKCDVPYDRFPIGTKVGRIFTVPEFDGAPPDEQYCIGTVTCRSIKNPHKLVLWMDEPICQDGRGVHVAVYPNTLTKLAFTPEIVCPDCHKPKCQENDNPKNPCPTCEPEKWKQLFEQS